MMKSLGLFCAVVCVMGWTSASDAMNWHFLTTNNEGTKVRVAVGMNRRSMVTIPDHTPNAKRCTTRTINMHDFEQGMVALKDPVKRSCWVKPLGERETYEDTKKSIESGEEVPQLTENWIVPAESVKKGQVKRAVGNLLSDFCSDSDVYMLKQDRGERSNPVNLGACQRNCLVCAVRGQGKESRQ